MPRLAALVVAAAFVPLAFAAEADPLEKAAIAAAEKMGGKADVDPELDEIARVAVKFDAIDDNDLIGLAKQPSVGAIEAFDASKVTGRGLAAIKDLPDLQRLNLARLPFGEATANHLAGIKTLQVLYLGETKLTDVGLVALAKLKHLRSLDVYDTRVTDKGLAAFAEHTKLQELNVSGTRVTDAGLKALAPVTTLKVIRAVRTNVTRNGAEAIEKEIPGLTVRY